MESERAVLLACCVGVEYFKDCFRQLCEDKPLCEIAPILGGIIQERIKGSVTPSDMDRFGVILSICQQHWIGCIAIHRILLAKQNS